MTTFPTISSVEVPATLIRPTVHFSHIVQQLQPQDNTEEMQVIVLGGTVRDELNRLGNSQETEETFLVQLLEAEDDAQRMAVCQAFANIVN